MFVCPSILETFSFDTPFAYPKCMHSSFNPSSFYVDPFLGLNLGLSLTLKTIEKQESIKKKKTYEKS